MARGGETLGPRCAATPTRQGNGIHAYSSMAFLQNAMVRSSSALRLFFRGLNDNVPLLFVIYSPSIPWDVPFYSTDDRSTSCSCHSGSQLSQLFDVACWHARHGMHGTPGHLLGRFSELRHSCLAKLLTLSSCLHPMYLLRYKGSSNPACRGSPAYVVVQHSASELMSGAARVHSSARGIVREWSSPTLFAILDAFDA